MNEQVLTDFYWTSLKRIEEQEQVLAEKGIGTPAEMRLIFSISAAGLLRHGVKFQVLEQKIEEPKVKKVGFLTIASSGETSGAVTSRVVFRDPEGNDHVCTEEELRNVMHGDYDRIVLKQKEEESRDAKPSIIIPDMEEIPDEPVPAPKEAAKPEEPEEKAVQDEARLPAFFKDSRYPDDPENKKFYDTFLYDQHDISVTYQNQSGVIHFYVFPLAVRQNERATDILVIAESGEVCRAGISRGIGSSVELEFADIPFVVRGSFSDGVFRSQINSLNEEVASSMKDEIKPHPADKRTSTTYVQIRYQGIDLNIFPAKFKNNGSTGYSPAAIAIERNRMLELLTPTSEGTFAVTGNGGENILVETYWVGGSSNPEFRVNISED